MRKKLILAMRVSEAERALLYGYYGDSGAMRDVLLRAARIGLSRELREENPELYENELSWVPEVENDELDA